MIPIVFVPSKSLQCSFVDIISLTFAATLVYSCTLCLLFHAKVLTTVAETLNDQSMGF